MKKDYLDYDIIELAQDDDFIEWAKSGVQDESWRSWLQQHPEKQSLIEEASALVRAIKIEDQPVSTAQIDRIWNTIDTATIAPVQQPKSNRRWVGWAIGIAAAIAVFVMVFLPKSSDRDVTLLLADSNILSESVLPDGSTVSLNTSSQLEFDPASWATERIVQLRGEAFFDVKRDENVPFVIQTALGTVEVLGTSFNVLSREDVFAVQCATGMVRVTTNTSEKSDTIRVGEGIVFENGVSIKDNIPPELAGIWQKTLIRLPQKKVADIVDILEKYYGVSIVISATNKEKEVDLFFEPQLPVDSVLNTLSTVLGTTWFKTNDTILIE